MRGDTSNTVVHPFFAPGMVALGIQIRTSATVSQQMVGLHAKYAQLAMEQVAEANRGCDAYLKTQISLLTATASLRARWPKLSREYLTAACVVLNAAKLRFIPTTGHPPELTEDVRERLAILSQNIYFENYLFLAVDGIEPKMTTRIEKEFINELQVSAPSPASSGAY
jgi:hypothetical protein